MYTFPKFLLALPAISSLAFAQMPDPVSGMVTGRLGNATIVTDNPGGVAFRAIFPTRNQFFPASSGLVRGIVVAQSNMDGTGVKYDIKIENLPDEGGPFVYHIHQKQVPIDGNCTETDAHLDPFERGEMPPCDSSQPETCQVGDLAGKHGAIPTSEFRTTYVDDYTSTTDGEAFMGELSVVVHFANRTRITCANFKPIGNLMAETNLDALLEQGDDEP